MTTMNMKGKKNASIATSIIKKQMLVKKKKTKQNRPLISNVQNAKKIFLSPNRVSTNFFPSVESNLGSGRFSL